VTLRPYLPGPRLGRATLRAVPRRGPLPPAVSAALRSRAIAIVAARAERHEPPITGAALAAELEVDPRTARAILDELRAAELAPPAVVAGASGRRMAAPPAPGKVVRLPQVVLERLAAATGRPVGEDVVRQIAAVLDLAVRR
jgi:hypothetical protein